MHAPVGVDERVLVGEVGRAPPHQLRDERGLARVGRAGQQDGAAVVGDDAAVDHGDVRLAPDHRLVQRALHARDSGQRARRRACDGAVDQDLEPIAVAGTPHLHEPIGRRPADRLARQPRHDVAVQRLRHGGRIADDGQVHAEERDTETPSSPGHEVTASGSNGATSLREQGGLGGDRGARHQAHAVERSA